MIRVAALTGDDIARCLPDVARLRIAVFRDWPYLYEGSMQYETNYLTKFAAAKGAIIVTTCDGEAIVGCATAAPLTDLQRLRALEAAGEMRNSTDWGAQPGAAPLGAQVEIVALT
jgi:hypothetical protein